jgi:para-nitrobenzyl esterase
MAPIVDTRSGKIEGTDHDGVLAFRGIPFAEPPVGARRSLPPGREAAWSGVRDCTHRAPYLAQNDMMLEQMLGSQEIGKDEGALVLNVFTPGLDGNRPVMVWIHGGAFMFGSGSTPWYDGDRFVQHGDVVVVTINYRLGPLGFMYLGDWLGADYAESGNAGLLDQIAALEWVRDCIAGFGGDPQQVTIFGESAGACSVGTLLGTPRARGLFQRAILQSGAATWGLELDDAQAKTATLMGELGIERGDRNAWIATPVDTILAAAGVLGLGGAGESTSLPFAPVHDGVVLPQAPLDAIAAGSAAGVEVLCGTNRDEMTLFNLMDPGISTLTDAGLLARVVPRFADLAQSVIDGYRAAAPDASIQDLWTAIATDALFRIPGLRLVEAQLAHAPTFVYLFTWQSPAFGGALKAAHAMEIPFVFDALDQPGVAMLTGDGPDRQPIADRMHAAWIAFARTGSPQTDAIPAWPRYDTDHRPTMRIDTEWELLDDPDGATRRLWDSWNGRQSA